MNTIRYIDRQSRQEKTEKIYGYFFLKILYSTSLMSRLICPFLLPIFAHLKSVSKWYGWIQKSSISRLKIKPFIKVFKIDTSEFLDPLDSFQSFNDFFIRKLRPASRPLAQGHDIAILPADGRYFAYENISKIPGFWIKGQKFSLEELLQDKQLAAQYAQGSIVIGRLAPVDYHRFHFPTNCLPNTSQEIPGPLYSVNPIALKTNIHILARNKRVITSLHTKNFGKILYIEVGATNVGSIHQTFMAQEPYAKGDEKGYFSFGGSCVILLFEPYKIQFDQDLLDASCRTLETRGLFGQSLGRALFPL